MIGCGNMGRALLKPWLNQRIFDQVSVIEPHGMAALSGWPADFYASFDNYKNAAAKAPDIMVLAVKPQAMADVLPLYRDAIGQETLVLSMAAGLPSVFYETILGAARPFVRIMPNLAAFVGQGMTLAVANKNVTAAQKQQVETMLAAVGRFAWLDDDQAIDAATLISGSGPAYVFFLAEILTEIAKKIGLDDDTAMLLARQTVIGGGALLADSDQPVAQLRQNVMSPGGVTEAAMKVLLENDAVQKIFNDAIRAGIARGDVLAGN